MQRLVVRESTQKGQRPRRRIVVRERIEHIEGYTNAMASRQRKDRTHRRVDECKGQSSEKGKTHRRVEHIEGQSPRQRLVVRERIDQIKGQRTRRRLVVIERIEQIEGQKPKRRLVVTVRERMEHIEGQRLRRRLVVSHLKVMCVSAEKVVGSGVFWGQNNCMC